MAFAAARMIKDKKDQESRKKSTDMHRSTSKTMNKVEQRRQPSVLKSCDLTL